MVVVYVIRCRVSGYRYVGITADLARRLKEHNRGGSVSTRGKGPFEVVLEEVYETYGEARQREKFLKSGVGRRWLEEEQGKD